MNIYISGISGTGMGPLALMAKDAGYTVFGSDKGGGAVLGELQESGIEVQVGVQDGGFLAEKATSVGVDWFVHTSALPENHPELSLARELGIKTSKRDDLIEYLVRVKELKMVAVAGTHGKTTTTAMIVWLCHKLNMPVSYLVGSTLPWGASGKYDNRSEFLVYEADEYDRNFLKFYPWLTVVTAVGYDHPDTYKTEAEYLAAFEQFRQQSGQVIEGVEAAEDLRLVGEFRRYDASLALAAVERILEHKKVIYKSGACKTVVDEFPGAGRRFERVVEGVYSDYAHHPEEVAATVKMAREMSDKVAVVYEPHQNTRQHEVRDGYRDAFVGVDKVFWLPTFLTREDESLEVLEPEDFIDKLSNKEVAEGAKMGDGLASELWELKDKGYLILLMSAGPADAWLRLVFDTQGAVG